MRVILFQIIRTVMQVFHHGLDLVGLLLRSQFVSWRFGGLGDRAICREHNRRKKPQRLPPAGEYCFHGWTEHDGSIGRLG